MELVERYLHDLYFESAVMILALINIGKYLEARSKGKTSQALQKLMDMAPKTAYLDLIMNDDSRRIAILRPRIISAIRHYMDSQGYIEFEPRFCSRFSGEQMQSRSSRIIMRWTRISICALPRSSH